MTKDPALTLPYLIAFSSGDTHSRNGRFHGFFNKVIEFKADLCPQDHWTLLDRLDILVVSKRPISSKFILDNYVIELHGFRDLVH